MYFARKSLMKKLYILMVCFLGLRGYAQTGIPVPQMTQCDGLIQNFLSQYNIPGATFAMAKDGKIVYMRAFGYQDVARTVPMQPYTLLRIASCSKPITSIAIMLLLQQGKLTLNQKVFGAGGILNNNPYFAAINYTDARINNITIRNLLEHSAGWDRDSVNCFPNPAPPYPYTFNGCDPIVAPLYVAAQTDGVNPVTKNELIKFLLKKGLDFNPGTKYVYSNIGFLILGRVIEQITGKDYDEWVKENIFDPLGICDIHLAKNLLANKQEREGEYVGNGYTTLSAYNTGQYVPWEYGGFNIEAMDSHGGWIATARDLVRLLVAVDGFSTKPDILTPAIEDTMTAPSATNANYAKGWQVNQYNNWWHTGALDGTATEIVRSSGGYTWAILLNKRDITVNTNFWSDLDNLPWNCLSSTTTWPTWDLMECPTTNSSAINFTSVTRNAVTVNWTNGNGNKRILVAHKSSSINGFPGDGTDYTANGSFSTGTDLGNGNYVVYNGTGTSATISNLMPDSTYYFRLFDYNNNAVTGNNSLYLRCNSTEGTVKTSAALAVKLGYFTAKAQGNAVNLQWKSLSEVNTKYYVIERSADAQRYTSIGSVTVGGQLAATYNFSDRSPLNNTNYYRLKMVDNDGSASYSGVVTVRFNKNGYLIYPSPAHDMVTVELLDNDVQKTDIEVVDYTGRTVIRQTTNSAVNHIQLNALTAGNYIIKIVSGTNVSQQKITKY